MLKFITNSEYHADSAIGSSGLKLINRSPAHYWAAYIDPERKSSDKKAYLSGRAWHCAVFESKDFQKRYAIDHDANKLTNKAKALKEALQCKSFEEAFEKLTPIYDASTTKAGKQAIEEARFLGKIPIDGDDFLWASDWVVKHFGKEILSEEKFKEIQKSAAIAHQHPETRKIFAEQNGFAESSIFTLLDEFGLTVKIRPDYMIMPCENYPNGLIVDGKSTQDASADAFGKSIWRYDYGLQAAFYTMVFQKEFGTSARPDFLWMAQELESPHAVKYWQAPDHLLDYWDLKIAGLLATAAECQARASYPAYSEDVEFAQLPGYAESAIDFEDEPEVQF